MNSDGSSDESEMNIDESDGHSSHAENSEGGNEIIDTQKFFVETTILQLVRLSTKIRDSGTKYRHLKADASLNRHDFDDDISFWVNDILGRRIRPDPQAGFPLNLEKPDYFDPSLLTVVQERLIDANLFRLNRIMFARRRAVTIPEVEKRPSSFASQRLPNNELHQPELQQEQQQHNDTTKSIPHTAVHTATAVGSQLMDTKLAAIAEPSVASCATRIGKRGDLEYPRCPKPLTDGASLLCPYCSNIIPSEYHKTPSIWR